jgi:hypothetical protein
MSDDYLWDRSGSADPDVQQLEGLLGPLAHDRPLNEVALRRRARRPRWPIFAVAALAAAGLIVYLALPRDRHRTCGGTEGFAFVGDGGDVSCDGGRVAAGTLPVGGSLDTGGRGAELMIAGIGSARLGPQTRVRLERSDADRHQLALEHGHLHAKVDAPPRLFAVTTKHTDIIDLGCEYTIDVDRDGVGSICVLTGFVELATKTGALVAPEASCAALLAGQRPGVPVGRGANPQVKAAAAAFDRGEPGAVAKLLASAEEQDSITLIAVATVDPVGRRAVLERLYELSPPPDVDVTVDSAMENPAMFEIWRRDIAEVYRGIYAPKLPR